MKKLVLLIAFVFAGLTLSAQFLKLPNMRVYQVWKGDTLKITVYADSNVISGNKGAATKYVIDMYAYLNKYTSTSAHDTLFLWLDGNTGKIDTIRKSDMAVGTALFADSSNVTNFAWNLEGLDTNGVYIGAATNLACVTKKIDTVEDCSGDEYVVCKDSFAIIGNIKQYSSTAKGKYSVALGDSCMSSGRYSFAVGLEDTASGLFSFTCGEHNKATNQSAVAMGGTNRATGYGSVALGELNNPSGDNSTAIGTSNIASGARSVAIGRTDTASGQISFTMGLENKSYGNYSSTFGIQTKATAEYSNAAGWGTYSGSFGMTALGVFNDTTDEHTWDKLDWIATDPLFVVGNGTPYVSRSNALTILKDGTVSFKYYTFPLIDGTNGLTLKTNGAGVVSWGTGLTDSTHCYKVFQLDSIYNCNNRMKISGNILFGGILHTSPSSVTNIYSGDTIKRSVKSTISAGYYDNKIDTSAYASIYGCSAVKILSLSTTAMAMGATACVITGSPMSGIWKGANSYISGGTHNIQMGGKYDSIKVTGNGKWQGIISSSYGYLTASTGSSNGILFSTNDSILAAGGSNNVCIAGNGNKISGGVSNSAIIGGGALKLTRTSTVMTPDLWITGLRIQDVADSTYEINADSTLWQVTHNSIKVKSHFGATLANIKSIAAAPAGTEITIYGTDDLAVVKMVPGVGLKCEVVGLGLDDNITLITLDGTNWIQKGAVRNN